MKRLADLHRAWLSRSAQVATCCAAAMMAAPSLLAQAGNVPVNHPAVKAALASLKSTNAWTVEQQISICEIAAPPFKESVRAEEYRRRLTALGLTNVRIDAEGNVIAERVGTGNGPTVLVSAHLDTVFPEGTDVTVKRNGTRLSGAGIGDDCRGLATLLAVARALNQAKVETRGTIYFVGTVGEEGAGNLRGVRHLFTNEFKGKIDYFISVDGTGMGLTSRGVGSHSYRVTYQGPGGHSYGDFGIPNPIHALGRAIAHIGELQVPSIPKTTFSVGMVRGGTSVNSIAPEAGMDVDLRSESPDALKQLASDFRAAVERAVTEENARWPGEKARISVKIDTIGIRPAGSQPDSATVVRTALAALGALGRSTSTAAGSTDGNFPMSLGIPSITMDAGGTGDGAHAPGEWYDDGPEGWLGPQWVALVVVMLAGLAGLRG